MERNLSTYLVRLVTSVNLPVSHVTVAQLGMYDCHQGGVTVDRECDSPKGGVKDIRKVCQLVGRCDGHGGDVDGEV